MSFAPQQDSESGVKNCSKSSFTSLQYSKLRKINEVDEVSIDFDNQTLRDRELKRMMMVEDPIVEGGSESFVSCEKSLPFKSS